MTKQYVRRPPLHPTLLAFLSDVTGEPLTRGEDLELGEAGMGGLTVVITPTARHVVLTAEQHAQFAALERTYPIAYWVEVAE